VATSDQEEPAGAGRDWLGQLWLPLAVTVIGTAISRLTELQPLAVFAATAAVALLVVIKLRWQQTTAEWSDGRATLGLAIAYLYLFFAAYLLVRSL
jgi:hypothetical protein